MNNTSHNIQPMLEDRLDELWSLENDSDRKEEYEQLSHKEKWELRRAIHLLFRLTHGKRFTTMDNIVYNTPIGYISSYAEYVYDLFDNSLEYTNPLLYQQLNEVMNDSTLTDEEKTTRMLQIWQDLQGNQFKNNKFKPNYK